ncbi:MAG: hypothetical protein JNK46_15090 [Methylobacteriaceae bacterium]|nr:hypothetical protein [Methylobacteriaceae bacterium]
MPRPSKSAGKSTPKPARKPLRTGVVTMRELQKMSAGAIEALPHPVPIKSGDRTVGILSPGPRRISPEEMAEIAASIRAAAAARSKEADARLAAYIGEPVDE